MTKIISLPLICTRGSVIFPGQELTIEVGRKTSVDALNYSRNNNLDVVIISQKDISIDNPDSNQIFDYGTISKLKICRNHDNHFRATFIGNDRCHVKKFYVLDDVNFVDVEILNDDFSDPLEVEVLTKKALVEYNLIAQKQNRPSLMIKGISNFDIQLASLIVDSFANQFIRSFVDKQNFLEEISVIKRLEMMLEFVYKEKQMEIVEKEINDRVKEKVEETQKDYYLREKLKAIKDELNDGGAESEIDKYREMVENNPYPDSVKTKANNEFKRYEMIPNGTGESGVILSYLDWLLNIPWYQKSEDNKDLSLASKILDEDHFGLEKVKERILEYLAVKTMTNSLKSPIICLVGPPGVGKTSLAKSVARALDRKFVKISLGGVKDEAEIRGHRRTYLGSLPGRIIQGMKKAQVINPVFLIDEIDKLASDYKGDPSSAMLEVLDPEQNNQFSDHYIEESYDLSDVLFIATANYEENIPAALKDRLEIIHLSSYTEQEKMMIASNHLIKKQIEFNGLKPNQFKINDEMLLYLIRHYTREAGVRQLERHVATLCRKTALAILKENKRSITVNKKIINEWLGHEIFEYGLKDKKDQIGVVNGLAYTQFGGDILQIESTYFKGDGKLIVTGQLGDVMKESCHIALDYLKANCSKYGFDIDFFKNNDIHIHVPEGAVPKDGPSAGVTLTCALYSMISGKKVSKDIAMTGEVTLRGNVLPIGGLKEKSLAAHRSGITKICIPKANIKDLDDVPAIVKESITYVPCEKIDDVLKEAIKNA